MPIFYVQAMMYAAMLDAMFRGWGSRKDRVTIATIHPSYILRIRDDSDKHAQYRQFVADLKLCIRALAKKAA